MRNCSSNRKIFHNTFSINYTVILICTLGYFWRMDICNLWPLNNDTTQNRFIIIREDISIWWSMLNSRCVTLTCTERIIKRDTLIRNLTLHRKWSFFRTTPPSAVQNGAWRRKTLPDVSLKSRDIRPDETCVRSFPPGTSGKMVGVSPNERLVKM